MGTHSNISVKVGLVYHTVYTHWDGYPDWLGRMLVNYYNSQELAEKLVSIGDLSAVDQSCDKPEGHSFDTPVKGYCIYYGRDRGDEQTEMQVRSHPRGEEEYAYVWDGSQWSMTGHGYKNAAVSEVLMEIDDQ